MTTAIEHLKSTLNGLGLKSMCYTKIGYHVAIVNTLGNTGVNR
jgi:hypothetical protein